MNTKSSCVVEFSPAESGDCIWARGSSLRFLSRFTGRIGGRLTSAEAACAFAEELSADVVEHNERALLAAGDLDPDRVRRLLDQ